MYLFKEGGEGLTISVFFLVSKRIFYILMSGITFS